MSVLSYCDWGVVDWEKIVVKMEIFWTIRTFGEWGILKLLNCEWMHWLVEIECILLGNPVKAIDFWI